MGLAPPKGDYAPLNISSCSSLHRGRSGGIIEETAPEAADLPQAGAAEVLKVFALMQKARPGLSSTGLAEIETAVKAKKAAAWLRDQAVKNEKQ